MFKILRGKKYLGRWHAIGQSEWTLTAEILVAPRQSRF